MKHLSHLSTILCGLVISTGVAMAGNTHTDTGHHHGHTQGIGKPGKLSQVRHTIKIDMADSMRFDPAHITVKQGDTVRFVVKNSGKIKHELILGTLKALREHGESMKNSPDMAHIEANMISVDAGQSGELIWQFTQAGKIHFACLQPGHYDAGMTGTVQVIGAHKKQTHQKGISHASTQ